MTTAIWYILHYFAWTYCFNAVFFFVAWLYGRQNPRRVRHRTNNDREMDRVLFALSPLTAPFTVLVTLATACEQAREFLRKIR